MSREARKPVIRAAELLENQRRFGIDEVFDGGAHGDLLNADEFR